AAGLEIGGKRLGDPGGFGLGRLVTGAEFIDAVDDAGRGRRIVVDRLAETNDVRELHGVQLTAAIDRRPVLGRAEAADRIEILHREPDRVHDLVAAGAGRRGAV